MRIGKRRERVLLREFQAILNDYIDDVLEEPKFHRFRDLPLELRQEVYKQYLLNNRQSVCVEWPNITLEETRMLYRFRRPGKKPRHLFPALCVVNNTTGAEVTLYLLQNAIFTFWEGKRIKPFVAMLKDYRLGDFLSDVRRITLNDPGSPCLKPVGYPQCVDYQMQHTLTPLGQFPQLRELILKPSDGFFSVHRGFDLRTGRHFGDPLHKVFDLSPIIQFPNVRKVILWGSDDLELLEEGDVPQALVELGESLAALFMSVQRSAEVRVERSIREEEEIVEVTVCPSWRVQAIQSGLQSPKVEIAMG
ncbi:hypothetical protein BDV96DRAFT_56936 [Lophiotrema nucula]|uniref:2EXR domain-containing protein n=1 Tax=Lophiotrema nucula TaxID=690887 RepID=A0A6A5Z9B9_9PLEO|nr:hypothetical protein BDV96DRAFT_56936 [Lophiotrema nucula]